LKFVCIKSLNLELISEECNKNVEYFMWILKTFLQKVAWLSHATETSRYLWKVYTDGKYTPRESIDPGKYRPMESIDLCKV
jgi:hypothetical protein